MRPPDSELILSFVSNSDINMESVYIYAWYNDITLVAWFGNWCNKKIVYSIINCIYYLYSCILNIYNDILWYLPCINI
jgi:hypothetical protein